MRSFISISPPKEVVRAISSLQQQIAESIGDDAARFLDPARADKFHLTLRFLGEMQPDQRSALEAALAEIAFSYAPFTIDLAHIGVFPNPRRPSVLWLGISTNPTLARLQAEVEAAAQTAGFAGEGRAWSPHLTLARVRRSLFGSGLKLLAEGVQRAQSDAGIASWSASFRAENMELMRSDLMPQGARYTVLREFEFSERVT